MQRANDIVTENLKCWMDASEKLNTQAALARAAQVGQAHISRILRGEANPSIGILESIARAFRRSLIDLLTPPSAVAAEPPADLNLAPGTPLAERELLQAYRDASPEVREIMLATARIATRNSSLSADRTG